MSYLSDIFAKQKAMYAVGGINVLRCRESSFDGYDTYLNSSRKSRIKRMKKIFGHSRRVSERLRSLKRCGDYTGP